MLIPSLIRIPTAHNKLLVKKGFELMMLGKEILSVKQEGTGRQDLLSKLLESKSLSVDELQSNVFVFFFAGHETTANTLSWSVFYMAKYPHFQQIIYDEIMESASEGPDLAQRVKKLTFLDMFIKEVLRVVAPVPMMQKRVAKTDVIICGYHIPAGFSIMPCVDALHYSEDFWKEPNEFDPYRFTPENSEGRNPYSYAPFSVGRRNCIGNNFSILELKLAITVLLEKYSIVYTEEPVKHEHNFFTAPKEMRVTLKLRNCE